MTPARPTFPVVGAITPLMFGLGLWAFLQSPFALVGAVLGPVMVVAHFVDSLRRHQKDARIRFESESRAAEAAARDRWAESDAERVMANRTHPSIRQILGNPDWRPWMDGRTDVRAGSMPRDGVPGFPWLVSLAGGVAVIGSGTAAESVWVSLLVHGSEAHGPPDRTGHHVSWSTGAWIHRGEHDDAGLVIRCVDQHIDTVCARGHLPERGDWQPDDVTGWAQVFERCSVRDDDVEWGDRKRCASGVGLANAMPFTLDPSSEAPHVVICGRTGTGKSEFLSALLCDWAERFAPSELSWVGIDFKGGATLEPLARLPNNRGIVTDLDGRMVDRALDGLAAEMRDRERALRLEGISRIEDSRDIGRLVIVVDEYPELIRQFPRASEVLADIARRGRSLGVHVVVTTQHTTAIHRDGLAANIPIRVCFPLSHPHEVSSVLGGTPTIQPAIGRPIVSTGDGRQCRVTVRRGATVQQTRVVSGERLPPVWIEPIEPPSFGVIGFGLRDDSRLRSQAPVHWSPGDGDVVVVGKRGSGRTSAIRALTRQLPVTRATDVSDIVSATGVIVVDDLDRLHDSLPDSRKHELAALIASRRLEPDAPRFVFSVTQWNPRLHGLVPNVLVLSTVNRDAHLATGEPAETFDPSAKPGVGSWRGLRVVVYARTESIVTDGSP